jgi:hypothetical protein
MAGSETRRDRTKYVSLDEHLAECIANNKRLGRGWCPLIAWLKQQPSETLDDVIAAELFMQQHPEWGPGYCADVIRDTWRFNSPDAVEVIQLDHALALVRHPWERARVAVENLLGHPDTGWQSREALQLVLDYVVENHGNPKALLARPDVRERLPVWVNISELPCPDFAALSAASMTGLGRQIPI